MRASTDDPSALCQQSYRGAAQRTGAELEERREEQRTGEESRGEEQEVEGRTVSPPTGGITLCSIRSLQHAFGE